MRKIVLVARIFIKMLPAFVTSSLLLGDFMAWAADNLLFFIVAILWMHCFFVCLALTQLMVTKYKKYQSFEISTSRIAMRFIFFSKQIILKRLFLSVLIGPRHRIVSGLFWREPTYLLVYTNFYGKLKILSLSYVLILLFTLLFYIVMSSVGKLLI